MPNTPSNLSADQCIRSAYNDETSALKVDIGAELVVNSGSLEVAINAATDSIRVSDGTDTLAVNSDGSVNVQAASLPLPTGAATETTLSSLNTKIPNSLTVSATRLLVDGSGVTQPVSAANLPLPTGAATSAAQAQLIDAVEATNNIVSAVNSSTAALSSGSSFTGVAEDVSLYNSVVTAVKTDQAGSLYMEFSPDGTNWDSSVLFNVVADVNEVHTQTITRRYFRVRFVNTSGSSQTYFRLQTLFGEHVPVTSAMNTPLQSDADAIATKSVLFGQNPSGDYVQVPVTPEGHLEMAVHGPLTPFGAVHTEKMTPILQIDGVYGINESELRTTSQSSGTVSTANNLITCSTGTTVGAFASVQSRRRIRYRPGQGIEAMFTALWSTPVANSIVIAGMGSAESGYYFGYNGTSFGILWVTGGVREIQTLTVTTASTSTNNYNVQLNGTTTNVTATNNGSTLRTAYEISQGTYPGWTAQAIGSTVVFLANDAGNKTGAFSLAQSGAGTPAAGTFVETLAGVSSTDTWITKQNWNVDSLDGSGPSGFTLDTSKGNIFAIDMQYLGFGVVNFYVETTSTTSNNPTWTRVHSILHPNTRTTPHITQPSLPFTMAAYSAGSTSNASVSTASIAGFLEGSESLTGPRMTYTATSTTVSTGSYFALATIRNDLVFKNRANQTVVRLLSVGLAHDDSTPVYIFLLKNATLLGNPNFTAWSSTSTTSVDTSATTATISDNNQIILSVPVGDAGDALLAFEDKVTLQPGESVTIAARTVTGTATYVIASLNTREDQ